LGIHRVVTNCLGSLLHGYRQP